MFNSQRGRSSYLRRRSVLLLLTLSSCLSVPPAKAQSTLQSDWSSYGGDPGGSRFSALSEINQKNVVQLRVAWTYRTGAMQQKTELIRKAAFEATPILADGKLFLSTPYDHVIALDPQLGAKLWEFDP